MSRGDVFRDPGSSGLQELLVVGPEDVDVVRLLRQLPDALECDGGGVALLDLDVAAAAVALSVLRSIDQLVCSARLAK